MIREGQTDGWPRHGTPLCSLRCMNEAELTVDGVPYCVDCADLLVEREIAVSLNPELVGYLPPLTYGREEYERFRASRGPADPRSVSGDSDELRRLATEWAASPYNPNAGRAGRPSADAPKPRKDSQRVGVTPVEPHEASPEPAGQLSLLAEPG